MHYKIFSELKDFVKFNWGNNEMAHFRKIKKGDWLVSNIEEENVFPLKMKACLIVFRPLKTQLN